MVTDSEKVDSGIRSFLGLLDPAVDSSLVADMGSSSVVALVSFHIVDSYALNPASYHLNYTYHC